MGEILLNSGEISYKTGDFINIGELYDVVSKMGSTFGEIKCSEKIGVVTFTFSGTKIIISKFGRVTIQRAKNKEQLQEISNYIVNLLMEWKVIIGDVKFS